MNKKCPECGSYNTIYVAKKMVGETPQGIYICKDCFAKFMDDMQETEPSIKYNPKFKMSYLKKKIPEIAEHDKFKHEDKITKSDIKDLQIMWWELKHGKKLEDLI